MWNNVQNIHCCLNRKDNWESSPTRSYRHWQSFSEMWLFFWVLGQPSESSEGRTLLASLADAVGATPRVPHNLMHLFPLLSSFVRKLPLALQNPLCPRDIPYPSTPGQTLINVWVAQGRGQHERPTCLKVGQLWGVSQAPELPWDQAKAQSSWDLIFPALAWCGHLSSYEPNKSGASKPLPEALLLENPP